jgi:hypothetical protein
MAVAQTNAELQFVITTLRVENEKQQAVIRNLQEALAATKAENMLLRQQWAEAQVRAQTLGANPADSEAKTAQRQLTEAVRRLALAEVEQEKLAAQLRRLVTAVQSNGNVAGEVAAAAALLAQPASTELPAMVAGRLAAAKVVDVNPQLRAVVLDVGGQQGVRVGMPFLVLRGDRVVAELRVVEVRTRVSGALIEHVEKGVTLRAGDGARVTQTTGAELHEARPGNEKDILWKSKR